MDEETIFDRILSHKLPAKVVYEDEDVLAFHDINPQAPTHVLIIPKQRCRQYAELHGLDDAYVGRYFKKAAHVAKELGLDEHGYRIVVNNGRYGQQSVDYLHVHLLGGRQLCWPPG